MTGIDIQPRTIRPWYIEFYMTVSDAKRPIGTVDSAQILEWLGRMSASGLRKEKKRSGESFIRPLIIRRLKTALSFLNHAAVSITPFLVDKPTAMVRSLVLAWTMELRLDKERRISIVVAGPHLKGEKAILQIRREVIYDP